ncbi:DoxX-like family protein [Terrimonas rubra]|uniref:DoxX-like family protein n=1 Tax=Terrimonas rubra TaxID=1035890 RepID=A0ABW5ZZX2_9BACT
MTPTVKHTHLTYLIAAVWLINGLFCKVLHLVPRHEQIVARILGPEYAPLLTILIGCSEILMALWIISRYKQKLNTVVQITVVALMNIIEFVLAPDLLLWGRLNILFALVFIVVVYYNHFFAEKHITPNNPV